MIKFKVSRNKKVKINIGGTPADLWKEVAILVSEVYKAIKKDYPDAAEQFKLNLMTMVLAPDSPLWKGE